MFGQRSPLIRILAFLVCFALPSIAQNPASQLHSRQVGPAAPETLKMTTRMVTLEVVVKDKKGHHVTGLKREDFEIFEQTPSRSKQKHEQKIASLREVSVANLSRKTAPAASPESGVSTNAVAAQRDPVPPTILLVDGLNTEFQYQQRVHAQSVKMLAQLPSDVPVAVFLLGFKLEMLQDFTSDPRLLHAAVLKAVSLAGHNFAQVDP